MSRISSIIALVLILVMSISSCKDFGVEPDWEIFPGKSVEGIELGFSTTQVEAVLGKPNLGGWADGAWRTWQHYTYSRGEGKYALQICFIDYPSDNPPWLPQPPIGPVDCIVMKAGYRGTTREGIGIGSSASFVHQMWGQPRKRIGPYESYCFNGKFFHFLFEADTVALMSMGYLIPCPADTFSTCN